VQWAPYKPFVITPPDLPVTVIVLFDRYSGPILPDGTVPIVPLCQTWSTFGNQCSCLQLPLKLAWAVTLYKAQGLTLNKLCADVGKKKFSAGLKFVANSRVKHLTDLLLNLPFAFQHLKNLARSQRIDETKKDNLKH